MSNNRSTALPFLNGLKDGTTYQVRGYGPLVARYRESHIALCKPGSDGKEDEAVLAVMRMGTRVMDAKTMQFIELRPADVREVG
jgi:hypothetical protein